MEQKLEEIYSFLSTNQKYNKAIQEAHYKSVIYSRETVPEKVILLLYRTVNTQSQPKINKIAHFFKSVYGKKNELTSFKGFINTVTEGNTNQSGYISLYNGLKNQASWGKKTAALFTKSVFHLHNGEYEENLKIWDDAPSNINDNDRLYLPVDVVITKIFQELRFENAKFDSINDMLIQKYPGNKLALWDDLWFWGFITQIVSGTGRRLGWNENKYWCIEGSNKDPEYIEKVKSLANDFIDLINNNGQ